jgi:hypothetical protein
MDEAVYEADQAYGKLVAVKDPALMDGYHYWANVVVDWMSGGGVRVVPFVSQATHNKIAQKWATTCGVRDRNTLGRTHAILDGWT